MFSSYFYRSEKPVKLFITPCLLLVIHGVILIIAIVHSKTNKFQTNDFYKHRCY